MNEPIVLEAETVHYYPEHKCLTARVWVGDDEVSIVMDEKKVPESFRPRVYPIPPGMISDAVREQVKNALESFVLSGDEAWALAEEALKALRGETA